MKIPGSASVWIVGAVALVTSVLACLRHAPAPLIHDEFSYLLAGETYAAGRLANEAHPLWEHFETMHVLQQPAYASKYLPGQGFALAVGTWLGKPIVGVWLSMVLAAMAITWMLEGWIARPWPLIGGLLFALHPQFAQAWGGTYWGGGVATLGAALIYGVLPRLLKHPGARYAAIFVLGAFLLSITRPLEGLVAFVPIAAVLFWALGGHPKWFNGDTGAVFFAGLVGTVAFHMVQNYASTGTPLMLPYLAYHEQYEVVPLFPFLPLREAPEYLHDTLRLFFTGAVVFEYEGLQSMQGFIETVWTRVLRMSRFFYGFATVPVVLVALFSLGDARVRLSLATVALGAAVLSVETFYQPHYAAPFVPAGILLATCLAARLWDVERWRTAVQLVMVGVLTSVLVGHWLRAEDVARDRESYALSRRGELESSLAADGGQHLVIVRYADNHNPHLEWVWNAADIDRAAVVWAREMDPERNARLTAYYLDRKVWLLEPDRDPESVTPYPVADSD